MAECGLVIEIIASLQLTPLVFLFREVEVFAISDKTFPYSAEEVVSILDVSRMYFLISTLFAVPFKSFSPVSGVS